MTSENEKPWFESMTDAEISGFIKGFEAGMKYGLEVLRSGADEMKKLDDYEEDSDTSASFNISEALLDCAEAIELVGTASVDMFKKWTRPV